MGVLEIYSFSSPRRECGVRISEWKKNKSKYYIETHTHPSSKQKRLIFVFGTRGVLLFCFVISFFVFKNSTHFTHTNAIALKQTHNIFFLSRNTLSKKDNAFGICSTQNTICHNVWDDEPYMSIGYQLGNPKGKQNRNRFRDPNLVCGVLSNR